jgi:hypothetical protein
MRGQNAVGRFRDEAGQAAAVVALLLFFVFLPLAALTIDGGMVYLVRRDLQNVADAAALAACRVIASNDTTTTPMAAALGTIQNNLGASEPFVGSNPPGTNTGAGVNLIKGIEVSTIEVRVALQRNAPTVLTQFVGRGQTPVTAQARCNSTAGGGLMPIAVQRYDGGPGGSMVDYVANQAAPPYPSDSITHTWSGRYGPFDVPVPDAYSPSEDNPGPEVVLLGQAAETNNGVPSMRDLVLLDIRNVASQNELEYYNGADTQADAAKDMSRAWIWAHGYPGPFPLVGEQVAILDGASNDYTARAMYLDAQYRPGDVVAAIVYDGNVWQKPDFTVSLQPVGSNQTNGIATIPPVNQSAAITYNLTIQPSAWSAPAFFDLSLDFTNLPLPPDTHVAFNGTELSGPPYVSSINVSGPWNGTLQIWSGAASVPTNTFLSGVNVTASSIGVTHGASSNFGFGTMVNYDYTVRSNLGKLIVEPGTNNTANLITFGTNTFPGSQGCKNVPVHAELVGQFWDTFFSSSQDIQINIPRGIKTQGFSLNVKPGAPAQAWPTSYSLRFTVGGSSSNCSPFPTHVVEIPIDVVAPPTNATPDKFVFIQGYALFRVTRVEPNVNSPNTVYAQSVGPLVSSLTEITYGLRPRLVPWN